MTGKATVAHFDAGRLAGLGIRASAVVAWIEHLIEAQAAGHVRTAPKATIDIPDGRYAMATMAVCDNPPYMVVKSLLLNPANPAAGEPLMNAVVTIQDACSGALLATMDGNWITALRTAALSATAARSLARPDSCCIAFIGSGLQARQHLAAFAEAFPLRQARIFGRGAANVAHLSDAARAVGLEVHAAASARDALEGADIIVSSVTRDPDAAPFIDAGWAGPGAFAALTDLAAPWLPATLPAFDRIIVDDLVQEAAMKKRLVPETLVAGDLAQLVRGEVAGRRAANERTAFIFRGHALGDLALAVLAYETATGRR